MTLTPRERTELALDVAKQVIAMLDARDGRPALVDAHGLAKALGVSVSTVDRWTAQCWVPIKLRVGSIRRFDVADVIAALSTLKDVA